MYELQNAEAVFGTAASRTRAGWAKRAVDVFFASTAALCVFPWLVPLVAAAIKLTSKGPVFFRQERVGQHRRTILCYKFRSMVADSSDVDGNGRYRQATRRDPRLTAVGRILRPTHLDELPQLLNVLKGDMALVGPRPHPLPLDRECRDVIRGYELRHRVPPGMTGWAQVHGHLGETCSLEHMQQRIDHDLWYIENGSLWLDLRILAMTVVHVVRSPFVS